MVVLTSLDAPGYGYTEPIDVAIGPLKRFHQLDVLIGIEVHLTWLNQDAGV